MSTTALLDFVKRSLFMNSGNPVPVFIFVLMTFISVPLVSGEEVCLECHGEKDFITERDGREISLYVDNAMFQKSLHGENGCVSCHPDADVEEFPHPERLAPVNCGECHDEAAEQYAKSLHGQAWKEAKYLAPNCAACHGKHDILPPSNEKSRTYVMNIPALCGSCHKEGTTVSQLQSIDQHHVLNNYSQSIHGDGLFKRGLIVTAVCTSCHSYHEILPHENPDSTINRNNIAGTCMKCHAQIERVHLKVIKGELWEKKPHEIPVCIDCHQPHNVRRVFYEESFPDKLCMSCHSDQALKKVVNGVEHSLYVDYDQHQRSAHNANSCIKCHTNISITRNPVCLESGKVDCSICHAEQVNDYEISQHGVLHARGNTIAPYCTDCHGIHDVKKKNDLTSPIFPRNIVALCGRCHREGEKAAVAYRGNQHEIIKNYTMSIHGKGLLESGLLVTATCTDCHSSHRELPASDPRSLVNSANIATTCAKCHLGIYEEFKNSIHSPLVAKTDKKLPTCKDCHLSHSINRVDMNDFRQGIINQCGKCHTEVLETYFETFHGKVSKLGSVKTAKCYDCHGAHNILPISNPASILSKQNIVDTCKQCHPGSNRKFVGYLTHATHHNKSRYPYLFYTFWLMTFLLVGTFAFFGAHTILWAPRALKERWTKGKKPPPVREHYYRRFDTFSRFLHLLVIISFLSLAITGMTIKFSGVGVFQVMSRILGGYETTGFIHRVAAVITFTYFLLHIGYLIRKKQRYKISMLQMATGENTLLFRKKDLTDFIATIKWFLGLGPRPEYGRWTYWEKFDYFAVFWGVTIIGSSGLMLWFPQFFTRLGIPGWLINVATIIHSDEALLATGFIFTIHFFNTHFRPDVFPMDLVIFTGAVPLEHLKEDRPEEYRSVIQSRMVKDRMTTKPPVWLEKGAKIFGLTCLGIGLMIIVLIIYSMIFLYR